MNFHRQLAAGMQHSPASLDWWLAGGLDPAKVVVAYEPIRAQDIADSAINVANPGTDDVTFGVTGKAYAPTLTAGVGWGFELVDTLGRAAVIPFAMDTLPAERITLVKVSGLVDSDHNTVTGYNSPTSEEDYWLIARSTGVYGRYGAQSSSIIATGIASGIMGLRRTSSNTTTQLWIDGAIAGSQTSDYTLNSVSTDETTIGCSVTESDTYSSWLRGTVGAFFIGQNMSDAEIINISNAMAAL